MGSLGGKPGSGVQSLQPPHEHATRKTQSSLDRVMGTVWVYQTKKRGEAGEEGTQEGAMVVAEGTGVSKREKVGMERGMVIAAMAIRLQLEHWAGLKVSRSFYRQAIWWGLDNSLISKQEAAVIAQMGNAMGTNTAHWSINLQMGVNSASTNVQGLTLKNHGHLKPIAKGTLCPKPMYLGSQRICLRYVLHALEKP